MNSDRRRLLLAYPELVAAGGFAVAQPLLSVFGRSPDEFIYRQSRPWQIVVFALLVCFALPTAVWLVEALVGLLSERIARILHLVALGGFAALFTAVLVRRNADLGDGLVLLLAIAGAVGFVVLFVRFALARSWLRFAALAVPVFVVLFVFASSVSPLVRRRTVDVVGSGVATGPSAVLVVFDEWPTSSIMGADGNVKADLFPNLARLAQTGTWYRDATSITNSTWHAVPTIFTGKLPKKDGVPEAYSHPQSIFTLLGGTYRMHVSETVTRVCPPELCSTPATGRVSGVVDLLDQAARVYRQMVSGDRGNVTAGFQEDAAVEAANAAGHDKKFARDQPLDVGAGMASGGSPARFDEFLAGMHEGERPTLHVLHILLPHVPYRYLPSGYQYPEGNNDLGRNGDDWVDEARPVQLANERMLLQAAYVDTLVGRLLDRMRQTKLLDRSMLVVTADHGIAFEPGQPVRGLETPMLPDDLYAETLWRPLFVKRPGQQHGGADDSNVMSIDIVPTIADALHVRIPWKVDGVVAGTRRTATKMFAKSTVNPFGVEVGAVQAFDGSRYFPAVLDHNVDALAPAVSAQDPLQLYRVGPHGDLVGAPVSSRRVTGSGGGSVSIADVGAYRTVDRRTNVVPALLTGTADRDETVVVAVNGVVAGVSATFRDGSEPRRFALMVPDPLLHDGSNRVDAYRLGGDGSLSPLRIG